jgi:hypothetical protein
MLRSAGPFKKIRQQPGYHKILVVGYYFVMVGYGLISIRDIV